MIEMRTIFRDRPTMPGANQTLVDRGVVVDYRDALAFDHRDPTLLLRKKMGHPVMGYEL